jgi:hypothetical protein
MQSMLAQVTCYLLHAHFLLGLFFDPADGSKIFLRNISRLSEDYISHTHRGENFKFCILALCNITEHIALLEPFKNSAWGISRGVVHFQSDS